MLVLALDCAVGTCNVGLVQNGVAMTRGSAMISSGAGPQFPELTCDVLRGQRVPDLIAVTVGPGSFTGIRSCLAFARGLASGWNQPIVAVTVIEALMHMMAPTDRPLWVALRSRAGHVFLGSRTRISSYALDALPDLGRNPVLVGDAAADVALQIGVERKASEWPECAVPHLHDIASVALARWAGSLSPLAAQPLYVDAPSVTQAAA